jgi:hypothetical protein
VPHRPETTQKGRRKPSEPRQREQTAPSASRESLENPQGVALDGTGNLIIADSVDHLIRVVAAAAGTFYGQAMTAGNIYTIAYCVSPSVEEISPYRVARCSVMSQDIEDILN